MTEKQQHKLRCETCGNTKGKDPKICKILDEEVYGSFMTSYIQGVVSRCGCASHTSALTLTPSLTAYYTERSQATGKPVSSLVLQDLAALHRKRVAREEKRVWKEIESERL